jgi:hypothetical protein
MQKAEHVEERGLAGAVRADDNTELRHVDEVYILECLEILQSDGFYSHVRTLDVASFDHLGRPARVSPSKSDNTP